MGEGGLLCELVVGERVGVGSLSVEFLLGQLGVALLHVGFAVVFALLTLVCCFAHCAGLFFYLFAPRQGGYKVDRV